MSKAKAKKGAKGKGKGKGKGNVEESEVEILRDKLQKAEMRIETLERYLVLRSEQTQRARQNQEEILEKFMQLDGDFEKEKAERFHIASNMIRQYKHMQDEYIKRINDSEAKRMHLKEQIALSKVAFEQKIKEKDEIIAQKDKKIAEMKQKMEDMVVEFGEMLRETLEQMGNTISASSKDDHQVSKALINDEKLKEIIGAEMFETKFKKGRRGSQLFSSKDEM